MAEYNVYLSEPLRKIGDYGDTVSSDGTVVRRIYKWILTGQEAWNVSTSTKTYYTDISVIQNRQLRVEENICVCSHYETMANVSSMVSVNDKRCCFGTGSSRMYIRDTDYTDVSAWQTYLQQQYSAGHPVEVWYVLANETTEQTTFPTITPAQGANTLTVSTTLAPSAITLTATSGVWPKNPIEPEEFGDLVTSGEHAGQYKIPITNSGQTYNIFLNEPLRKIGTYADKVRSDGVVERKVKKLVLTGNEIGGYEDVSGFAAAKMRIVDLRVGSKQYLFMCSHFEVRNSGQAVNYGLVDNKYYNYYNIEFYLPSTVTSTAEARAWFADLYAANDPVIFWYPLETPTTESITAPEIATTQGTNTLAIGTTLAPSKTTITGHVKPTEWYRVREAVRSGTAPTKYPIGTILYDNFDSTTGTALQVVGYDKHFDQDLTAKGYTHSMTLCEVLLDDVISFDNTEAFLYTTAAIPAGTYKFTIPNYDSSYGGNKTYYFVTTKAIPVGGQIVMSWPYNQVPASVSTYDSIAGTTAIESGLVLNEWVSGTSPTATDIGTIGGPTTQEGSSAYGRMNHIHRARYGSNNYLQSGLRQYLNSNRAANTWWEPQTVFDRPYGSRNIAGKMTKINAELLEVLATPTISSRTNSYFETDSLDGTTFTLSTDYTISTDKIFLLSPHEIGFNNDTTVGAVLDFYASAVDNDRIKKRKSNNNAYYWWLRTPYPSYANSVRLVRPSGALYNYNATNSYGVAAACVIQ